MDKPPEIPGKKSNAEDSLYDHWIPRVPYLYDKKFFELQYEFAKIISEKNGMDIMNVISWATCDLRGHGYVFDKNWVAMQPKEGITAENIVEEVYKECAEENSKAEPVVYHKSGEKRFGCFWYGNDRITNQSERIPIHFFNAEFDIVGPLDKSKIEKRRREMADTLRDIRAQYPDAKTITGRSWMLGIASFQKLFPPSFISNLKPDLNVDAWSRGTTIWGQFIDSEGKLKEDLAMELIERLKALKQVKPLSQLFENGSRIMPPLISEAPIEDFLKMYEIE